MGNDDQEREEQKKKRGGGRSESIAYDRPVEKRESQKENNISIESNSCNRHNFLLQRGGKNREKRESNVIVAAGAVRAEKKERREGRGKQKRTKNETK